MSTDGNGLDASADASAPARLLEDPEVSALVRQDLANVAAAAPSYDAAGGLLALQAAIGAGAKVTAAAAGAGAATVKGALGLKLVIAGSAIAIAIAGAVALITAPQREAPAPGETAALQHTAPVAPLPTAPVPAAPVPADAPLQAPAPSVTPEPIGPASHEARAPRDRAAAEIAQLAQIKAAVEAAPARALRLAEQGHRQFGEGYLHHEREGLAIVALHALGRYDEAHRRAGRYLARYPRSSLSERVRALQAKEQP